jgi:thymidine kinase
MQRLGYLEVIAGPMYCGKTEELIRQVKRAVIGKKKVQVFKHKIDTRYGTDKKVYSHTGMVFDSDLVETAKELLDAIKPDTEIIAIDEAQYFGNELIQAVGELLDRQMHVIIAGLALTYDRQPFLPIPSLMAMADKVTKLSAVCSICGADAVYHKRLKNNTTVDPLTADPALVNNLKDNVYEARCRNCYNK